MNRKFRHRGSVLLITIFSTSLLSAITISLNGNSMLEADEIEITLTTLVAKRW
jgi:hypothetical protein